MRNILGLRKSFEVGEVVGVEGHGEEGVFCLLAEEEV